MMNRTTHISDRRFWLTDMPGWLMLLLVAVGLPRTILADLDIVPPESGLLYYVLALTPFAAWLAVAVLRPGRKPVWEFLVLGVLYGLSLVVVHQLLWDLAPPVSYNRAISALIAMAIGVGTGLVAALAAVTSKAVRSHRSDTPASGSQTIGPPPTTRSTG
jgi:hypothetical protein